MKFKNSFLNIILVFCIFTTVALAVTQNTGNNNMNTLNITPATIESLKKFEKISKFNEREEHDYYPGAPDETVRARCEKAINQMVAELISGLPENPKKEYVLSTFAKHLKKLEMEDTEEREEACYYCEKIMEILSIESSDGVLNTWLYGFDPS